MTKHALKILRCLYHKIFKVSLTIFQHYAWKSQLWIIEVSKPIFERAYIEWVLFVKIVFTLEIVSKLCF